MLVDNFNRKIDYLRISVTDRCNLRCVYCMPEEGIVNRPHEKLLTYEEIVKLVQIFVSLGITKLRLTGGEPLVRKDMLGLVRTLSDIEEIVDLSMTTNGILLKDYLVALKKAGLKRLNISLDSLNAARFKLITRGGNLASVREAILEAIDLGFSPLKINVLLLEDLEKSEISEFLELTRYMPVHVRFLEFMPAYFALSRRAEGILPDEVLEIAHKLGAIEAISLHGNGSAKVYRINDSKGTFGLITPMSNKFCSSCNRLRLTSFGELLGCLHSTSKVNLREPLREGASKDEIAQLIELAVAEKPAEHSLDRNTAHNYKHSMCQIGG